MQIQGHLPSKLPLDPLTGPSSSLSHTGVETAFAPAPRCRLTISTEPKKQPVENGSISQRSAEDINGSLSRAIAELERHQTTLKDSFDNIPGSAIVSVAGKLSQIERLIKKTIREQQAFNRGIKPEESEASKKRNQALVESYQQNIVTPLEAQVRAVAAYTTEKGHLFQ